MNTFSIFIKFGTLFLAALAITSCRGMQSDKPPIHPNHNMDFQKRFNAQEENKFFADGRSMRSPVEGTVSRGNLRDNDEIYEGLTNSGDFVDESPFELTKSFLHRGKERYDIFCTPCHGTAGDGQGIIMVGQYGYVPAPSFHTELSRNMPEGQFYSAITNGIRSMPSYATQIPVEDRWAIVGYIRALQRSQYVPEEELEQRYDVDIDILVDQYYEEQDRLDALAEASASGANTDVSADRGRELYTTYACLACHSTDGSEMVGPTFAGLHGSEREFTDGTSTVADKDYIIESIMNPSAKVVDGYFDGVMQPHDHLTESELESLYEFIKSLSDN